MDKTKHGVVFTGVCIEKTEKPDGKGGIKHEALIKMPDIEKPFKVKISEELYKKVQEFAPMQVKVLSSFFNNNYYWRQAETV